jgi:hypothetical protein
VDFLRVAERLKRFKIGIYIKLIPADFKPPRDNRLNCAEVCVLERFKLVRRDFKRFHAVNYR